MSPHTQRRRELYVREHILFFIFRVTQTVALLIRAGRILLALERREENKSRIASLFMEMGERHQPFGAY